MALMTLATNGPSHHNDTKTQRAAEARVVPFLALCLSVLVILASSLPSSAAPTGVTIDASRPIATVPDGLYSVGYNGWGDITNPEAIRELKDVQVTFCRIDVDLKLLCGDRLGDYRWDYTTPRDLGQGFVARVKQIIANGWTPLLALSTSHSLPSWFKGEPSDAKSTPWTKLNLDGSPAADDKSDQYAQLEQITQAVAAGLAERGLKGLYWETIYEIGHTMPMAEIHYHAARGIRQADPTAKLTGPATWPGWTVEERFVKPYLAKYGPDLLDFVTVHWYADNEHGLWAAPGWKERKGPITMGDRLFLQYLMETTPKYADWCKSLRALLDDRRLNTPGKRIGIAYSEFDALAESPYQRNPENPDWPKYRADADCYLNTNYFGGVWCASVLCDLAASGACDIACKFNTRDFYGLIENKPGDKGYFRMPVWFAWKLLQDVGRLRPGNTMLACEVSGPTDGAAAHVGGKDTPWVQAFAVRDTGIAIPRIILINRSSEEQIARVRLSGVPAGGDWQLTRYLYDQNRVAPFIGRKPGTKDEGRFEGVPDDSLNERCLQSAGHVFAHREGTTATLPELKLPPVSITVLAAIF
jgi:hypothetical protein